jgi:hypothetical protein
MIATRLSAQWLQRNGSIFLDRGKADLLEAVNRSQENQRLEIRRSFLGEMVECLKQYLPGACAELVLT